VMPRRAGTGRAEVLPTTQWSDFRNGCSRTPNGTLPYSLWQDSAITTEWRNTDPNRMIFMADPPHQTRNIYGVLHPQPGLQPGLYTDVITVTIEF